MSVRGDLKLARPWLARQMAPATAHGPWEVVAPKRFGKGFTTVASMLCEEDAKAIAEAGSHEADVPH